MTVSRWQDERRSLEASSPKVQASVAREKTPAAAIIVNDVLDEPHKLIATARRLLARTKPNIDGFVHCGRDRCLDISVSPASLDRALRIMDALIKACIARGLSVEVTDVSRDDAQRPYDRNDDQTPPSGTRILVDDEWITVRLVEKYSIERPPVPKPPRGLSGSALDTWTWINKPRAVHVPNGVLELLLFGSYPHAKWKDGKRQRLEACLNDVVAHLFILAEGIKRARNEEAERKKRREEEERLRSERERREEADRQRAKDLQTQIANWRLVRDIREYVAEIRAIMSAASLAPAEGSDLERTLRWALSYAERIDPLHDLRIEVSGLGSGRDKPEQRNEEDP